MASGGPKKIGKYDVLGVIGRGPTGIVYRAVDPGIGRTVAIKITTGSLGKDAELLKRFHGEAQSVGKLQHPNIATVYDLGVEEGSPYLVMELLEGDSLESLLRSRRSISLEEKLDIVIQICNGIQYAHQHNVIHRNIKPANIMLLKDGTVKIVDFGIARLGVQKLTPPGQLVGSFQYMSPEQINATNVDSRADIFSVGVLLFELVTGTLPFEGKDTGAMLLKILHDPPPPLNGLIKNCPPGLEDIVQRSLAKNPEQRYQTAKDLALGLTNVLEKLRRERVSEYLQGAETAAAQRQWSRAKEQLLQVLKIDPQNARANVRMREVQAEFQKQQRSERAKELQAQAEHAMAQSDLSRALAYLNEAVEMDRSNMEIVKLRDSIQENRTHGDKLQDLMQRAELAQDAGDLVKARQAVEEGLALDPQNTDFRSMQVVIAQRIAACDKQKRVQEFVSEARKEISSRRFTAALEVLRKAEALDSSAAVVQELLALASTGQQQEQRRQELERLTAQIEEALEKEDYAASAAKIKEGLARYPEDRGLLKLKVIVDKQREETEKRRYIEEQTAQARKLLDGGQATQAFAILQSALEKLPSEPSLHAMVVLVKQSIERTRKEREKAEIQSAREAIRRKAYSEAISILQAARKKTPSSELDELLQFAQNEAESQVKRQKIDAVAEEARQLTSRDKYPEAIALLKRTLREIKDQELQIILADIERHVAEFNAGVEKAVATAGQLLQEGRYVEAIKFLEGQDAEYGKVPKFRETLEDVRRKQQAVHALPVFKAAAKRQPGATSERPMESAPVESPEAAEVPAVKPLPTGSLDDKQEQAVNECLAKARELQGAGYLALASSRVREMLASYPRQHRLIEMLETLEQEIESQRRQVRLNDLHELRRMEEQAGTLTEKTALQAFGERTRAIASKHPGDAEVLAASERVLERISKATLRKQKEAVRPAPQEVARAAMPAYYKLQLVLKDGSDGTEYPVQFEVAVGLSTEGNLVVSQDLHSLPSVCARVFVQDKALFVEGRSATGEGVFLRLASAYVLEQQDVFVAGKQIFHYQETPCDKPETAAPSTKLADIKPAVTAELVRTDAKGNPTGRYPLNAPEVRLGRTRGTYVFPDDKLMSRAHFRILQRGEDFVLEDVGSRNGTFVKVRGKTPLSSGCSLLIAGQLLRVIH